MIVVGIIVFWFVHDKFYCLDFVVVSYEEEEVKRISASDIPTQQQMKATFIWGQRKGGFIINNTIAMTTKAIRPKTTVQTAPVAYVPQKRA